MAPTCIAPPEELQIEEKPVWVNEPRLEPRSEPEPEPGPLGWKQHVRALLVAIFEGHEEFLGYTPD